MEEHAPILDPHLPEYHRYIDRLMSALGHRDREEPLRAYLGGLLLPGERKTLRSVAGRLDPVRTSARHQSLHHFVTRSDWDESALLRIAREEALSALGPGEGPGAWVVSLRGQPKKGSHSVGVDRQLFGDGRAAQNGQITVVVDLVHPTLSVPVAWRLYLPKRWTAPGPLRSSARVPQWVRYRTIGGIALAEIDRLLEQGMPRAPICAGKELGDIDRFRSGLSDRGLPYVVELSPGRRFAPIEGPSDTGPSDSASRRQPIIEMELRAGPRATTLKLAGSVPAARWTAVPWVTREGTRTWSSFARVPVRVPSTSRGLGPGALVLERSPWGADPKRSWLSTVPEPASLGDLVELAKAPLRIDHGHRELEEEFGLGRYEGRQWRGFHHHAALSIAAYAFWSSRRVEVQLHPRPGPPAPSSDRVATVRTRSRSRPFRP